MTFPETLVTMIFPEMPAYAKLSRYYRRPFQRYLKRYGRLRDAAMDSCAAKRLCSDTTYGKKTRGDRGYFIIDAPGK